MPMQYLHTMVRISDVDASLRFYCDLLGIKEVRRYDSEKGRFTNIFLAAPADEKDGSSDKKAPLLELRSEEHTSELQSLMRISYAVFFMKKKTVVIYGSNVKNVKAIIWFLDRPRSNTKPSFESRMM